MGKVGKFFSNSLSGLKKGATKVWNFGRNTVGKVGHVLRPMANIAEKVGGVMSALPGKAGMIGSLIHGGASALKNITGMLPDSKAKTMIDQSINKGVNTSQRLLNKGVDVINNVNQKTQPWINAGVNITRKLF